MVVGLRGVRGPKVAGRRLPAPSPRVPEDSVDRVGDRRGGMFAACELRCLEVRGWPVFQGAEQGAPGDEGSRRHGVQ